ncbi:bifunctional folate synthesis protein [bacterium BMS3Abin04]|nr:bifunctional folate synthesis protein [bacterium BMS3Abin04]
MNKVFLALGSNEGDKISNLKNVITNISENENCSVKRISSVYASHPYGPVKQDDFLNMVVEIDTNFELKSLLSFTKNLEIKIGRKKSVKWGPREIDLDILLFNNIILKNEEITIPHKDLIKRDFVLRPLIETAPELIHPVYNKKIKEFINLDLNKYIFDVIPNSALNLLGESVA